jgi:hypothetical protein
MSERLKRASTQEELVGAFFHAAPRGHEVRIAGHEDDLFRLEFRIAADGFEECGAVAAGHMDIAEDQVGEMFSRHGEAGDAGVGLQDFVADTAQEFAVNVA